MSLHEASPFEHAGPSGHEIEVAACQLALAENAIEAIKCVVRDSAKAFAEAGVLDLDDVRRRPRQSLTVEEAIEGAVEYALDMIANLIDADRLETLRYTAAAEGVDD